VFPAPTSRQIHPVPPNFFATKNLKAATGYETGRFILPGSPALRFVPDTAFNRIDNISFTSWIFLSRVVYRTL
jgi:hypothetical protein